MNGEGEHNGRHQPGEVPVDGPRLPAVTGEDGTAEHRPNLALSGHQGERGGLNPGAEAEHTQLDGHFGRIRRKAGREGERHHTVSRSSSAGPSDLGQATEQIVGGLARLAGGADDRMIIRAQDLQPGADVIGVTDSGDDTERRTKIGS